MKKWKDKWGDVYEYDDSPEAFKTIVDGILLFLKNTGAAPDECSLFQSDAVQEESVHLVMEIITDGLKFRPAAHESAK